MKYLILLIFCTCTLIGHAQKFDSLALTPPMGWNTWNNFGCNVDEDLIKAAADEMVSSGMKNAGYEYIVIDDCWHGERDSLGFIHPDHKHFPSGMKALADYIHSKGLKFGIYSDAGWQTCAGKPGSRGHEFQDAMTYASWGVDYLKYDWCNTEGLKTEGAYMTMSRALRKAGRPIVLGICEWGNSEPWAWAKDIGHLWRTTGDIYPCWDCKYDHGDWYSWGVLKILDMRNNDTLRQSAGPGHWNDPDMMEVGNGMTESEDRGHFSMWCMLAAPLFAGNDLSKMSEETLSILTNKEAIAVDQDPLGVQGFKYLDKGELEVWFKPLKGGDWAVCFLNRGDEAYDLEFDWQSQNVEDEIFGYSADFDSKVYEMRDLWAGKNIGSTKKTLKKEVPSHDVLMLRLTNNK